MHISVMSVNKYYRFTFLTPNSWWSKTA